MVRCTFHLQKETLTANSTNINQNFNMLKNFLVLHYNNTNASLLVLHFLSVSLTREAKDPQFSDRRRKVQDCQKLQ